MQVNEILWTPASSVRSLNYGPALTTGPRQDFTITVGYRDEKPDLWRNYELQFKTVFLIAGHL
jgi:hypothetical protein